MSETFDLCIIGTGPGGYVCAIRAAQLGLKVAVVEKRATHGGTCLNVGCIPSKALLHASELFHEAEHEFSHYGITVSPKLDLKTMMKHKTDVMKANVTGIEFLFKKNKITAFQGSARIAAPGSVEVTEDQGKATTVAAKLIVIATGSESTPLPGIEVDEKKIVTSTGGLELTKVPKKMIVIGAGVIGLELGSVWARLGAEVTVVEYLDRILPGMDGEVAKTFQRMLSKQGFTFKLGQKVKGAKVKSGKVELEMEPAKGGKVEKITADVALLAIGRRPFTEGLGLDEIGVTRDERGRIAVNAHLETSVSGIYAIGDVVAGAMLAHKAEEEGVALAEQLAGKAGHVNYEIIPGVVYTKPEVAQVGLTEEDLKAKAVDYKVGKFSLAGNGRAKAMRAADGFVKVLACAKTDRLLGAHIIGPAAGEMIHEVAVLMEFSGSSEDLARTCHAHPTLSEAVKEAALAVEKRAIHA